MPRRQREREVRHDGVEERHARLERVRHRRAVGLHEQVVDEVDAEVDVLQAREQLGALGLGEARAQEVDGSNGAAAGELRARVGEKISFQPWCRSSGGRCAARRSASPCSRSSPSRSSRQRSTSGAQRASPPTRARAGRPRTCSSRRRARRRPRPRARPSRPRGELARRGRSAAPTSPRTARRTRRRARAGAAPRRGAARARGGASRSARRRCARRRARRTSARRSRSRTSAAARRSPAPRARRARPSRRRRRAARRPGRRSTRCARTESRSRARSSSASSAVVLGAHLVRGHRRRPREALEPVRAVRLLPDEQVPGRQLADVAEDRQRRRDRVEREERLERVEVDLAARQRAQVGREREPAGGRAVDERLDPEAVAREHEPPPARVPERDGEHAAQERREAVAVLLVEVARAPRCRRACGSGGPPLELAAQLAVVVDLAVLDDRDRPVLVRRAAGRPSRGR